MYSLCPKYTPTTRELIPLRLKPSLERNVVELILHNTPLRCPSG
jgi:hypothetical protein